MYNKTLNVWSLGKLVSSVFPRVLMFPSTSENKTNCFPRDHTLSVYCLTRVRHNNLTETDKPVALEFQIELGIEPGTHWWEASALTTAPSLLPVSGFIAKTS